jgi:hypothetical protein
MAHRHNAALSAVSAEDGVDGDKLDKLVDEGKFLFPECQCLFLYFRSRTGCKKQCSALARSLVHTKWSEHLVQAGTYEGGEHGLLAFIALRLQKA